jgi:hypothetical protein
MFHHRVNVKICLELPIQLHMNINYAMHTCTVFSNSFIQVQRYSSSITKELSLLKDDMMYL